MKCGADNGRNEMILYQTSNRLSALAKQSEAWIQIERLLTERLEAYRTRLEVESDPIKTERIRGRIEEVRSMLSLGKEREKLEPDANLGF